MAAWGARRRVVGAAAFVVAALLSNISGPTAAAPSQAELTVAKHRLMELEKDFELVVERYDATQERLDSIQSRMASIGLVVRHLEHQMVDKQRTAVALATQLYKGGSTGAVEVVLSAKDISEIDSRLAYLRSSEAAQARVFERLAVDKKVLNAKLAELEDARMEAQQAEERLAALKGTIEDKVASQKDEIATLNAQIARAERRARRRAAAAAAAAAPATSTIASEPARPAPAPNAGAAAAVDAALSQVGKPYQWGAAGPDAYDCSGLTMWAWAHAGVSLPHSSAAQYAATPRVSSSDWQPGDLLFYGSPIHHVSMYIGNGQMVEAPYTGTTVRVTSARRSDYVGAGRPGV